MLENKWTLVAVAAVIVVALVASFAIGRSTASDAPPEAAGADPTTTTLPVMPPTYGDEAARASYVSAVNGSLGVVAAPTDEELLAAGDSLCADLEGFTVQGRDALYAIRILWTDQLRYLDAAEVAVFGVVLAAAPEHLCPQYQPLALEIAYWLGV